MEHLKPLGGRIAAGEEAMAGSGTPSVNLVNEAMVREEMNRMSRLPRNSTYVVHRLRVLHKILHLLSIQRTASDDQELQLLFAGLSL